VRDGDKKSANIENAELQNDRSGPRQAILVRTPGRLGDAPIESPFSGAIADSAGIPALYCPAAANPLQAKNLPQIFAGNALADAVE
jgi:hypothetical protein